MKGIVRTTVYCFLASGIIKSAMNVIYMVYGRGDTNCVPIKADKCTHLLPIFDRLLEIRPAHLVSFQNQSSAIVKKKNASASYKPLTRQYFVHLFSEMPTRSLFESYWPPARHEQLFIRAHVGWSSMHDWGELTSTSFAVELAVIEWRVPLVGLRM